MKTKSLFSRGRFSVYALLLLAILVVAPDASPAGVVEVWARRSNPVVSHFVTIAHDQAYAISLDGSNNVIVTGASWVATNGVAYTVKYAAANGAILWQQRYDEPDSILIAPQVVAVDHRGDVIVTGYSFFANESTRLFVLKYASSDGALLWQKIGPRGDTKAAAVLAGGDIVVAGIAYGAPGGSNAWYVARYASASGSLLWEKRGPEGRAEAVAVDAFGNIVAFGNIFSTGEFYTVKYRGRDGRVLWDNRDNAGSIVNLATAVAVDRRGNVAVTGVTGNYPASDFYTAKYRGANGSRLWARRYSDVAYGTERPNAVAVDRRGNVLVTGQSWGGTNRSYTAKYAAADGSLLWERGRADNTGAAIALDNADDVIVAGTSYNGISYYPTDYHVAKYAGRNGALIWEKKYGGARSDFVASPRGLAISGNGVIALTGSSEPNVPGAVMFEFATVVYWETLPPISIERLPSAVRVRLRTMPGRVYHLQRASDVNGPWATLSTETSPASGMLECLDNTPPTAATFYRVRTE